MRRAFRQYAGPKPTPDRAVLTGVVFVLRSGIAWNLLRQEMGAAQVAPAGDGWPHGRRRESGPVPLLNRYSL